VWEAKRLNIKNLALATIFAALYAALVVGLAGISFQLVQVRIADALIPLSIIFGWPAVIGVTAGCVISNIVSPLPSVLVDITLGAVANFLASLLAWRIGKSKRPFSRFLGCLAATLVVTFLVGTYLALITETEFWVWWLGIGVGSLISICGIGYPLVEVLKRIKLG
jgi:uncharacterized membrane protein